MKTLYFALVVALSGLLGATASPATDTGASYCAGRGDVTFRAADGTRLVEHAFGRGEVAVVLAHQARGSLCQWVAYARRLASRGYTAFAFDFRDHGRSQRVPYQGSAHGVGLVSAPGRGRELLEAFLAAN